MKIYDTRKHSAFIANHKVKDFNVQPDEFARKMAKIMFALKYKYSGIELEFFAGTGNHSFFMLADRELNKFVFKLYSIHHDNLDLLHKGIDKILRSRGRISSVKSLLNDIGKLSLTLRLYNWIGKKSYNSKEISHNKLGSE